VATLPSMAAASGGTGVGLAALTRPELMFPDLAATDRQQLLDELASRVAAAGLVADAPKLATQLWERERLGSTAIGFGVAIPHCKLAGLRQGVVAIGRTAVPIDFGASDGGPVRLFFLVISPPAAPADHLQTLAAISRWIRLEGHSAALLAAPDAQAMYQLLAGET
jgi:PTS system nitrogen regulatory IIA component